MPTRTRRAGYESLADASRGRRGGQVAGRKPAEGPDYGHGTSASVIFPRSMRKSQVPPHAGWFHVMNRIAPGTVWFRDQRQARAVLKQLGGACVLGGADLHAFCILPGHYHLLVRAEPAALEAVLARFESGSGFATDRSPRALPVQFGRHLMGVSRYIHLNPVAAGLVWCPEDWPYSSFRSYLGDIQAPSWIVTEAVLGRFGTIGSRHRHRAYVYAGLDPGTRDGDGRPHWAALFGSGSETENRGWRIEPVVTARRAHTRRAPATVPRVSLRALARAVAREFDVPPDVLRSVRRGGTAAAIARGALVHAARSQGDHRLRDVAGFMGYASPAAAAAAAERFERANVNGGPSVRLHSASCTSAKGPANSS